MEIPYKAVLGFPHINRIHTAYTGFRYLHFRYLKFVWQNLPKSWLQPMYQEPNRTLRRITRWVHPQPPLDCETHRLVPKHKEKAFPSVSAVHLEKGSTVVVIALVDAPWATWRFGSWWMGNPHVFSTLKCGGSAAWTVGWVKPKLSNGQSPCFFFRWSLSLKNHPGVIPNLHGNATSEASRESLPVSSTKLSCKL